MKPTIDDSVAFEKVGSHWDGRKNETSRTYNVATGYFLNVSDKHISKYVNFWMLS